MRKIGLWSMFWLAGVIGGWAQVTVEVVQDQDQFVPGETIPAAVRITNRSGQTLSLGSDESWLSFSMESPEGQVVQRMGDVPVAGEFTLESSKIATRRVELSPYFSVNQPGRYLITATVKIKQWDQEITSPPKPFVVIKGSKLWEREVGLPQKAANPSGAPEVRKYLLQQANYLKRQVRLYLRISDADETRVFAVLPVGKMVSFSKPDPQVDAHSNLHILYQDGPHSSHYAVYNPDGQLLKRRAYEITNTRPRLRVDFDGEIEVVGGLRRPLPTDFPASTIDVPQDPGDKAAELPTK